MKVASEMENFENAVVTLNRCRGGLIEIHPGRVKIGPPNIGGELGSGGVKNVRTQNPRFW